MVNNWRTYLKVSAATLASGAAAIFTASTSAYGAPLVPAPTGAKEVRTHTQAPDTLTSARAATGDRVADIRIAQFVEVDRMSSERTTKPRMGQVTSVSQLSDIQPTDWAFGALQSLVERYGCIAGYPDGTYRPNRALTRYEFAAGLNACLDRINELIAAATVSQVRRQDIVILQRLQEDFATELAQLRGRVDSLEVRTGALEANRFSASNRPQGPLFSLGSSSRLLGEAIFVLSDVFSGEGETETVLQQRVRMVLLTSFTGKDLLFYRFTSLGNSRIRNLSGGTREGLLTSQFYGDSNNIDFSSFLEYIFPVGDKLHVHFSANFGSMWLLTVNTLNPYFDSYGGGNGALSIFGERNAIYRLSGGSGLALNYRFSNAWALAGGYLAEEPFNPSPGAGLFNGNYVAWGQLTWTPTRSFGVSFLYNNSYFNAGTFAFNDGGGVYGIRGFTGTGIMEDALAPFKVVANSYGGQFSWRINPKFVMSGWVGLTNVRAIGQGDGEIWNYALTFALPDLGGEGNLGGLVVGAEPYLGHLEGVTVPSNDTSIHIEAFYKYQVTPGITVTPGVIWITAPNQNRDNEDIVLGVVRTTFWF